MNISRDMVSDLSAILKTYPVRLDGHLADTVSMFTKTNSKFNLLNEFCKEIDNGFYENMDILSIQRIQYAQEHWSRIHVDAKYLRRNNYIPLAFTCALDVLKALHQKNNDVIIVAIIRAQMEKMKEHVYIKGKKDIFVSLPSCYLSFYLFHPYCDGPFDRLGLWKEKYPLLDLTFSTADLHLIEWMINNNNTCD